MSLRSAALMALGVSGAEPSLALAEPPSAKFVQANTDLKPRAWKSSGMFSSKKAANNPASCGPRSAALATKQPSSPSTASRRSSPSAPRGSAGSNGHAVLRMSGTSCGGAPCLDASPPDCAEARNFAKRRTKEPRAVESPHSLTKSRLRGSSNPSPPAPCAGGWQAERSTPNSNSTMCVLRASSRSSSMPTAASCVRARRWSSSSPALSSCTNVRSPRPAAAVPELRAAA
mmetsp:Transcript_164971/g.529580  ORF Transcript_164971/g.529580 Transcript_164971/m.529580 type:complete len:230 (+) Transcript_164971:537-1226(+)